MSGLQIYDPRERALVRAADVVLRPVAWARALRSAPRDPIRRILLLRLERIGDLLMTRTAFAQVRACWPDAEIDLVVGSWNAALAALIPGMSRVLTADVPWLAREGAGLTWPALLAEARRWRGASYDLAINFEPDIRSNVLLWRSGAPRRFGYWTGGGGALLTHTAAYDPSAHVSVNAERLVERAAAAAGVTAAAVSPAPLTVPSGALARADARLAGARRPLIGVHASGGRESKQWHLDRFAETARRLAADREATIVLTGSAADRTQVERVRAGLDGVATIDTAGALELVDLAALLSRLDLLVTGDTGPMHLAAAVGTPVVALFGPSDPRRYGPTSPMQRVLRVDLPCSPCGQVRLPPERCRGHVPDCMDGIAVGAVTAAAAELLDEAAR